MKRFYKEVSITGDGGILLDARPVRTPARALLALPNEALADAVAQEWRDQDTEIDPRSMPLTGLANAAIDRVEPAWTDFAADLASYGETELLCYRAEEPPELVALQSQDWNPILGWAQGRYDISFRLVRGIMHEPQPEETPARLAEAIGALSAWELAALSPIITISGSLVIGLAILEEALTPETGFDAAHLDELWQARQWGEDDLALEARATRRVDFLAACHFLRLLRG